MAIIQPYPRFKALLDDGTPAVGYKVYSYDAGTTTPKNTYADQSGATPNANPVILDGSGEASIFLTTGGYKLVLTDDLDAPVWSQDGLNVEDDLSVVNLTASGTTSLQATSVASLTCSSSALVTNLNADHLDSADWAQPLALGSTTPAAVTGTAVQANTSLKVASTGTAIKQIRLFTGVAVDPGSIATVSRGSIEVTIAGTPGIAVGDVIIPVQGVTGINDDLIFMGCTATAADKVTFFFYNPTGGGIDDTSHNWDILWIDVS